MSRLKKLLKDDSEYKTFKLIVKKCGVLADFDNLTKEMETMHMSRKSRLLHLKTPSVDKLISASGQATAFRSRIVEIMVNVQKAQRTLDSAIQRMEAHIMTKYKQNLVGRAVNDRKLEVKNALDSAYSKLSDFDRIVDMCKEFIADIESFNWTAKLHMQGLELVYTRENVVSSKLTRR
jgi:hypothetical protein